MHARYAASFGLNEYPDMSDNGTSSYRHATTQACMRHSFGVLSSTRREENVLVMKAIELGSKEEKTGGRCVSSFLTINK